MGLWSWLLYQDDDTPVSQRLLLPGGSQHRAGVPRRPRVARWVHAELGAHCSAGFSVAVSQFLEVLAMAFPISKWGEKPSYFRRPGYTFENGFVSQI